MYRYILRRLIMIIPVLIGVSFCVFFILDLAPGDPVYLLVDEGATLEEIAAVRAKYGLDGTVFERYFIYMKNLLKGDLGYSFTWRRDVMSIYLERLPSTIQLAAAASLLGIVIGLPMGIIASLHRGTWIDASANVVSLAGLSLPNHWFGLMLIIVFALKLHWLPSFGKETFRHLILPAIVLGTDRSASIMRHTRSAMLEVLSQDYLQTARAKGVSERKVITKHAFKNALIPILTVAGLQFSGTLGGAVITETVFSWPGVGLLAVDALNMRDFPLAIGCNIMTTMLAGFILLLIDLSYALVDPRIKARFAKRGTRHDE